MSSESIWQLKNSNEDLIQSLVKSLDISRIMATLLVQRGLTTTKMVQNYLEISPDNLSDPFALPEMTKGAARIAMAIRNGEKILIYGDYDVDGITGTVLLTDLLRRLGGKVKYYLPDRNEEGYGLHQQALLQVKEKGITLIVSVDCGISSYEEAVMIKKWGMDLVITDHHQVPPQIPTAEAIINPKLAPRDKPWYDLAGVGVAFKVGQAVTSLFDRESICGEYLDLVALGTIADLVPLTAENRILVQMGLQQINQTGGRLGLQALIKIAGLKKEQISTRQVGFILAPRLNACGRLGKADLAAHLLFSTDSAEAEQICQDLGQENRTRQELGDKIYREALAMLEEQGGIGESKLIFLASPDWHPGVIGIVASRLVDKFHRPVILLNIADGQAKGSGRSIPGFNLYQALEYVRKQLIIFGGHEMAIGLTLSVESIESVGHKLGEYAAKVIDQKCLTPVLSLDAEVFPEEINEQLVTELNLLAPHGYGNPTPLLVLRQSKVKKVNKVGKGENHLKVWVEDTNRQIEGIGFQLGKRSEEIIVGGQYDFAFCPQLNTYQGITRVQMLIEDFKNSAEPDIPLCFFPPAQIEEKIQRVFLGKGDYYEKQKETLQLLKNGHNTLLVLGTGRGKSAVFQSMAAYLAILKKQVTLLIYPLRSLVNDQYHRIREKMSLLGVPVSLANGSMGMAERKKFFKDLAQGKVGIVLTTPEFLSFHLKKFKQITEKIGLFVVDEAHHLAKSKRKGYYLLGQCWQQLGKPLALATTATADRETACLIQNILSCSRIVVENHVRQNLQIVDQRREKDKLKYLLELLDTGERIVIYVNSRQQASQLAQELSFFYPPSRQEIGFYHGGLYRQQRLFLEKAFRCGDLRVIVTTSAFGEGIDFPDIKHVVLYHLCFSLTEFNQLSGRAGRNQQTAKIHLLFNQQDRQLNELILHDLSPTRVVLGKFFLYLQKNIPENKPWLYDKRKLVREMRRLDLKNFSMRTASACLAILADLNLVSWEDQGNQEYILLHPLPPEKLNLTDSLCYMEGQDEWDEFQSFADTVLKKEKEELLQVINRPIIPAEIMSS